MENSLQLQTYKLPFNLLEEARREIQEVLAKFVGAIIYLLKAEGEATPPKTAPNSELEKTSNSELERKPTPRPIIVNQLNNAKRDPTSQL